MAKAKQAKAPAAEAMNVINKRFDPECAIGDITEHPRNAREGDVGALHVSIDHNGFYGALIVQESTGHILSGNHRYKAAVQKGAATIPVIWVDCDDAAALRIMVSDNRTSDIASYANDALAELLESIKIDETGLGFLGTGWEEEAYQNLLNDLAGISLGESTGEAADGAGETKPTRSLSERFGVPPFSVLDARQGYWQERKRAWLALGIKSELGRGGGLLMEAEQVTSQGLNYYRDQNKAKPSQAKPSIDASPGGSKMAMHNDPMQRKRKYDQ